MENSYNLEYFERLFVAAEEEYFEDGVYTQFSRAIMNAIKTEGIRALYYIEICVFNRRFSAEVVGECLRWLGTVETLGDVREKICYILVKSLLDENTYIRDGAVVGIAYLDDPINLSGLIRAYKTEKISEIKFYMRETILQLLDTAQEILK